MPAPRQLLWASVLWLGVLSTASLQADDEESVTPAAGVAWNEGAVDKLLTRLSSAESSFKVRAQAAVLLGRLGDIRAVPALIRALEYDEHFVVRSAAATALGALADDRATEALFVAAGEPEPIVRDAAGRALGRVDARRNFDTLVRYAREGSAPQRRVAIARLGDLARTGDAQAVDLLINALGDDEGSVRDASAAALSDLPTDKALPILVGALQHESAGVRAEAARLLGPRQDSRAVEALATAYDRAGEQERVRLEIRRSLERLRPQVNLSDVMGQARRAPDKQLRVRAIRLLGVVGDPRAASVLEDLLTDADPFVAGSAALALSDLGSLQSIARLEEAVKVANPRTLGPMETALKRLKRQKDQQR